MDVGGAGSDLQDAGHGLAVTGDGSPGLGAHIGGLLTADDRRSALDTRVIALDGERSARRPGERRSAQRARPATRFVQEEAQLVPERVD